MEILVVFCTFPGMEPARQVASRLVEENFAACVNLLPGLESVYRWEGKVETAAEVLAVIKTTAERYSALEERLRVLHPYDVPEIVALPVAHALAAYAGWVSESVSIPD